MGNEELKMSTSLKDVKGVIPLSPPHDSVEFHPKSEAEVEDADSEKEISCANGQGRFCEFLSMSMVA